MKSRLDGPSVMYWLARRGRFQRWLAAQVGIAETDLSHALHDRKYAPEALIERIAAALDVSTADITREEAGHGDGR